MDDGKGRPLGGAVLESPAFTAVPSSLQRLRRRHALCAVCVAHSVTVAADAAAFADGLAIARCLGDWVYGSMGSLMKLMV